MYEISYNLICFITNAISIVEGHVIVPVEFHNRAHLDISVSFEPYGSTWSLELLGESGSSKANGLS